MNIKLRVILLTMSISLLVWAVCAALGLILFRQSVPAAGFTSNQVILSVSTFIVVLAASVAVGLIMSRTMLQRRKALEELKESEERVHALSEATVEGIIIHDGSIFLEANDVSARMLGLEPSEIRGKLFVDYIAPESRELVLHNIREGFTEPYEVILRREGGITFPAELCGRDATYKGKKVRVVSMRDITQRKKIEVELRFRGDLLDACSDSMLFHDFDGTPLYINEAACRAHGYTHEEMMTVNFRRLIVPEYGRMLRSEIEEIEKKGDVIFESAHYRKDGSILPLEIHARIFKWGDKEYILSIGRDITERKKAEAELRFRSELLDACSDSLLWHDDDGTPLYVNEAACRAHGYTHEEMMKVNLRELVIPEYARLLPSIDEEIEKKGDVIFESAHYRKDGSILPLEIHARTFKWGDKKLAFSICRDITERKKTEAELRFRSELLDACSDSLLWSDADGNFVYVNEAACKAHGYTHDEMMQVNISKVIVPEYRQIAQSKTEEVLKNGDAVFECAHYRKDGSIVPLEIHAHVFKTGDEEHVLSICRDITERKKAEELLKTISLNSPAGIFVMQDNKYQFVNPRMIEKTGYTEAELMTMDTDMLIHPEDQRKVREEVVKALKGEKTTSCEYRCGRKDGVLVWMQGSIELIQYRGRRAILGTVVDITAQKEAEEALKGSETRYHELVNTITSGVVVYKVIGDGEDFVFVDFNNAAEKIERIGREYVIGKKVTEVFPGVKDFGLFKVFQRVWQTGNTEYFPSAIYKDERDPGTWRENWVYKLPDGDIAAVYNDVTERKLVEETLRKSELSLREAQALGKIGNWEFDVVTKKLEWSDEVYRLYERDRKLGPPVLEEETYYDPVDAKKVDEFVRLAIEEGREFRYDIKVNLPSGHMVFLNASVHPIKYKDGHVRKLFGTVQDITARKLAEEALQMSEKNFRTSLDDSPLGIRISDIDNQTLYANQALLDIFGYKDIDEVRAKSPQEYYSPEYYTEYLNMREIYGRGDIVPDHVDIDIIRKDGTVRHLQALFKVIFWDGRKQYQTLYNDITERKKAEEALRTSEINFHTSIDDSPLGICIVRTDGKTVYANQRFLDMCGYANLQEYLSTPPEERYTPESYQGYLERKEKRNSGDVTDFNYKLSIIRKDGKIRYLEVFSKIVLWGGELHYQVLNIDITERVLAENALKASEERFRRLAENIPDVVSRFNLIPPRGYEYISPASTTVTGYTPEEYYANPELGSDMVYPEDKKVQQMMSNKPELYKGVPLVTRYVRKDGRIVWVERRQMPIYDEDGKLIALEGIDRDVTEDIRMEEALRMSETNFRNSMDNSPLGVRIEGADGETIYANRKLLEMYGYENLAEFRAKSIQERLTPESHKGYLGFIEKEKRGESSPENYEVSIIHKNGSISQLEVFRKKVLWGGEPQFQLLYNDVTKRKQAENQRKLSLTVLAMLNQPKAQKELIKNILLTLKEFSGCEAVGIRLHDGDDYPYYETNGFPKVHLAAENHLCGRNRRGKLIRDFQGNPVLECMCGNVISGRFNPEKPFFTTGGSFWTNSTTDLLATTTEDDRQARTRNRCNGEGYESVALIPLKTDHETIGLLQLNDQHRNRFTAELIHFFEDIAQSIGIALSQKRAEEAVYASEVRYRRLFETAKDGILIIDAHSGSIVDVNPFLTGLLGLSHQDFIGKNLWELGFFKDIVSSKENFLELQRDEYIRYEDLLLQAADGRRMDVEFVSNVYSVDHRKIIQCNIRDITDRKKAYQALRESEEKYRELVETAQEGILISDADSKITFANQRLLEIQGYTAAELVGKYVYDFLDEQGRAILKQQLEERRLGIKGEYDTQILHKNGSLIYVRVGSTPLYDNDGKYIGVMSVIVDISALKNAEEHILHLNSVLNALRGISQLITLEKDRGSFLQKSCDLLVNARGYETAWVALTDENGKFVSGVSSGIESKIFSPIIKDFIKGKYPPCTGDLLQQKENILLCPQLGSQHTDCPLEELGDNLGNLTGRLEYDGRLYGVLSVQLPSKLAGNKEEQELFKELTGDVAFALDSLEKATQLAEAEAKAREAEKLREVDRLRSELLANVSHELRTPLASIKGYTSTLLRTDVKWAESQRLDFLRTVDVETDRLTKLINDILDMSRIDGGALKLRQEQYQISEILNSIMGRLKAITADHKLKINIPKKLPAVFADEMRIGQVISNLVDNATKFSPTGTEISISAIHDKDRVIVSVTDHGVGMSKEVINQLFNRFYQADNVVTGRRHGTGLGLAICRGIIESHGGKIWVESKVGEGSKFSFSLPLRKEESNA